MRCPAAPRHGIDSGPPLARWASPGRRLVRKRQQEIGGDVTLRSPSEHTLRILEIVGLTQIFTIA